MHVSPFPILYILLAYVTFKFGLLVVFDGELKKEFKWNKNK